MWRWLMASTVPIHICFSCWLWRTVCYVVCIWWAIIILSSTVMALTRGVNGLFPCPVCLVPQSEQSNLSQSHPLRTADESQLIVMKALKETNAAGRNKITKEQSLRPVMVWFLYLKYPSINTSPLWYRMHFGRSDSLILIEQSHLMKCMLTIMVLEGSIFSHN
jgi:hypothetical protein